MPAEHRILVGRDEELARLMRAFTTAAAGDATFVLVTGEAGIGKSALVRTTLGETGRDLVLLEARCDESERELEYGVALQIIAAAPGAAEFSSPPLEPFQVGAVILDVIGSAAESDQPVVVVVDDAQWADSPSLNALAFLARRLRADRVLLCLVSRPDGVDRLPPGLLRQIEATGGTISLDGLDRDAVVALASIGYDVALDKPAGERLRAHTGGSPLHLRAVLESVPAPALKTAGPLPVPSSYASLVRSLVASCSTSARELLAALAVLGQESSLGEAAAVAGVEDPVAAAEELVRHGLADLIDNELGTTLGFRHGLVRASVLDALALSHRTQLHARAAEVLDGSEGVRHRLAAADSAHPELIAAAGDEADALVARGAPTPAARLLAAAARLLGRGPERQRMVLRAAMLLLEAGAPVEPLIPEIERYAAGPARDYVLGRLAFNHGDLTQGVELLERAWAAVGQQTALAALVADMMAIASTALGRFDELATWSRRAVASGNASLNSPVTLFYGVALDSSPGAAERELTALVESGQPEVLQLGARLARGMCLLALNELDRAETDLTGATLAPQVQGSLQAFVNARSFLAECHFRRGRWARAHDLAVSTTSIVDDAGAGWMAPLPHTVAATVLASTGDFEAARAHADEAWAAAETLGMVQAVLWARVAALRIAEAVGDPAQVVTIGDALLAPGIADLPDWVQRRRPAYAEALAALGRTNDAERHLAVVDSEVAANGDTSLATEAARARAAVHVATGDRPGAIEVLDAGLALDAERSGPFERARLELAAGALRRRAGDRREAAALLESASASLRALGARPWLERCERELAACGLTPIKRSAPDARADLTPRERLVANLVGAGLSNREIAAELVLSPKTVEFHLGRIYRKLELRSRGQLAALLATSRD